MQVLWSTGRQRVSGSARLVPRACSLPPRRHQGERVITQHVHHDEDRVAGARVLADAECMASGATRCPRTTVGSSHLVGSFGRR